jgi:hypothetical protein
MDLNLEHMALTTPFLGLLSATMVVELDLLGV